MRAALAALALALTGCVTFDIGEGVVQTHYVLTDPGPPPEPRAAPVAESLLIQADGGDPIADSRSIAYARHPGERAHYQLATWTDRPARRIPQLLQRRLEARGSFRAVAARGQPLLADWLLTVAIDDIHHDVATDPGRAKLAVRAALFDRRRHTLVARRAFSADVAVAEPTAAAAVAALNQGVAQVLDALVPWIEQEAADARGAGS